MSNGNSKIRVVYQKRIYRGISNKYVNFPLAASAMRTEDIRHLQDVFIDKFGYDEFINYRNMITQLPKSKIELFSNLGIRCSWAWYLSLSNILLAVYNDPLYINGIQYPEFISVFQNCTKNGIRQIPDFAFNITSEVFSSDESRTDFEVAQSSYSAASAMVYGFEYFQHLNYNLRTSGMHYNPFPTMVLDWTEDIAIANDFSNFGTVISIDYEKYIQLIYDEWFKIKFDVGISSTLAGGFTPYFDYHSKFSKKNRNMQIQKGVVLFWPWYSTISELLNNDLGDKLGLMELRLL